ncbi:MAG: protein phosphatase CheZ [Deltaproteobacteria bacterium]|nr:protein phosphatase CheZ [Deltaproteobacteria bacterium]
MSSMVMGNLDGDLEKIAFQMGDIARIVTRYDANLVTSTDEQGLFLELNGNVCPVQGPVDKEDIRAYFIIIVSGVSFNVSDYQILFNVKELENDLLSGTDVTGHQHLCRRYGTADVNKEHEETDISLDDIDEKIKAGELSGKDIKDLQDVIHKLREGEFFELLTMEFSNKIKVVAKELIDFRKDMQKKIEPDIVEMAARDIPEASNHLEGINKTLEESTMKIMDINEEQMEMANNQQKVLESIISGNGGGEGGLADITLDEALKVIEQQKEVLEKISNRTLTMMEPLSFQDLVGQRIQRIIKIVRSMELRVEELIVSFGIKLKKHREDPAKTYEDLNQDVDKYMTELKGPQREGEGLDQTGIDNLLESL